MSQWGSQGWSQNNSWSQNDSWSSNNSWSQNSGGSYKREEKKPGIKFGVRGDGLMNTRTDKGKNTKRYKTFQDPFQVEFAKAFGDFTMDYQLNSGEYIANVTQMIERGPYFDILIVGVLCLDLFTRDFKKSLLINYPEELDADLMRLASAIKSKSNGSLVLCGGPGEVWKYPQRWDSFMERAANTLRAGGVQVVPSAMAGAVMSQMEIGSDFTHFSNTDECKDAFAKGWAGWLLAAAADTNFGREIEATVTDRSEIDERFRQMPQRYDENGNILSDGGTARRRSRSPRNRFSMHPPTAAPAAGSSQTVQVKGSVQDLMSMGFGGGAATAEPLWEQQEVVQWIKPVIVYAMTSLPQEQQFPHVYGKLCEVRDRMSPELFSKTVESFQNALKKSN